MEGEEEEEEDPISAKVQGFSSFMVMVVGYCSLTAAYVQRPMGPPPSPRYSLDPSAPSLTTESGAPMVGRPGDGFERDGRLRSLKGLEER